MLSTSKRELFSGAHASHPESHFESPQSKPIRGQFYRQQGAKEAREQLHERTQEWLSNNLKSKDQLSKPNLDLSEELYQSLIDALQFLQDPIAHQAVDGPVEALKDGLRRLFLWGREYRDGRLSFVLCNAKELRDAVLDCLDKIGLSLLSLIEQSSDSEGLKHVQHLRSLLEQSSYDSRISSANLGDHVASHEIRQRSLNKLITEDNPHQSPDDCPSDDGASVYSAATDDAGICDIIDGEIDCLMELLPSIEQSYAYLQLSWDHPGTSKGRVFSVSTEALPFIQRVADRFNKAETDLVHRLGESNWQRFMIVRAQMDQTSQFGQQGQVAEERVSEPPISVIFKEDSKPKSMFLPQTLFHDSGLGTSIASALSQARSDASHTSFLSSCSGDLESSLRVPKTPAAVGLAEPFLCEICGKNLHRIRNRVDWKRHVFEDLQPYICTFPSCDKHLVKFASRSQWSDHEFSAHRVLRSWNCPECEDSSSSAALLERHLRESHPLVLDETQIPLVVASALSLQAAPIHDQECPLCRAIPGKSKRNFVKHLARHLESIALAVLPRDSEEESEEESDQESVFSEGSHLDRDHEVSQMQLQVAPDDSVQNTNLTIESKKNMEDSHRLPFTTDFSTDSLRRHKMLDLYPSTPSSSSTYQRVLHAEYNSQNRGIWECTLGCSLSYDNKEDWRRHESSHYPQQIWICDHPACFKEIHAFCHKDLARRHCSKEHKIEPTDRELEACHCFDERLDHVEEHYKNGEQVDHNSRILGTTRLRSYPSSSKLKFPAIDSDSEDETHHDNDSALANRSEPSGPRRSSPNSLQPRPPNRGRCHHPDCGRDFKDLKAHMLMHQVERSEKCPIVTCEYHTKGFARKHDRRMHTLTHYKGMMVCDFCPNSETAAEKSFNRVDVFRSHLTSVHGVEQSPPDSRKPRNVKSSHQKTEDTVGECKTCSSSFSNAQNFYDHLDDCVLKVLEQGEPSEKINEQHLKGINEDLEVKKTLDKHMLSSGVEYQNPVQEDGEEEDEDQEGQQPAHSVAREYQKFDTDIRPSGDLPLMTAGSPSYASPSERRESLSDDFEHAQDLRFEGWVCTCGQKFSYPKDKPARSDLHQHIVESNHLKFVKAYTPYPHNKEMAEQHK
ncbi:hypothetical protein MMC10_004443 [Thelotrema lepadinum]|nr:hypothetical protein [Thelotrema lepadinum]